MAGINNHLPIITLNVNYLKSLIKRHRLAEWIKKKSNNMLFTRNSHYRQRHPQAEGKQMEKNIPLQM